MIKDCKIKEVLTCIETDDVLEVSKILRDTQNRHLVVIDDQDAPKGFLSVVDINNRVVAEEIDPKSILAKEIMTNDVITFEETEKLSVAVETLMDKGFMSCPITRNGKLIGICDFKDMMIKMHEKGILGGEGDES